MKVNKIIFLPTSYQILWKKIFDFSYSFTTYWSLIYDGVRRLYIYMIWLEYWNIFHICRLIFSIHIYNIDTDMWYTYIILMMSTKHFPIRNCHSIWYTYTHICCRIFFLSLLNYKPCNMWVVKDVKLRKKCVAARKSFMDSKSRISQFAVIFFQLMTTCFCSPYWSSVGSIWAAKV